MFRGLVLIALLFLGRLWAANVSDASRVVVGPVPEWVRPQPTPEYGANLPEGASRGLYYFLLDQQTQVEKQESYSRVAYKVTSAAGLQGGSQISFSFDPGYQSLDLHTLAVVRDGQTQNRLILEKMQLLQQERDLERHQYNGQLTALFLLEDVRVGDVIEYSFTRKGENPIFGHHYMDTQLTQWGSPIGRQSIRVIAAAGHSLTYQQLGGKPLSLSTQSDGGLTIYEWRLKDRTAAQFEAGAPSWYLPLSLLQITDFQDWKEVVDWARPLYAPTPLSEPLRAKVQELVAGLKNDEERTVAVLDFVQNDIRYLGMELGPRSHAPSEPDQVFRLRYGDCKDKVRLFCALLNEIGISAVPALTHSDRGKKLKDWLPTIEAFDHVIARVDLGASSYWVDPTLTDQAGTLDLHALPDYGWALPIEAGSRTLQRVEHIGSSFGALHAPSLAYRALTSEPKQSDAAADASVARKDQTGHTEVRVTETFTVGKPDIPTQLQVKSVFRGLAADGMRAYLRATPSDEVGKHLLNMRAKLYANLKLLAAPTWKDDRRRNEVTLEHHYEVPVFWTKTEHSPALSAEIYPLILRDYLAAPETMVRTAPYAVQFPLHVVCETELHFWMPWSLKPESRTFSDAAFEGRYQSSGAGRDLNVRYEFTTLNDAVEASRMEEFATHLRDFRELLGTVLTFNPEIAKRNATFRWNWTSVSVAIVSLVGWGGLGFWIYRRPWGLRPLTIPPPAELIGRGGWLVLVAIGTFWRPVNQVFLTLRDHSKFMDLRQWELLNENTRITLSLELCGQIGLSVIGIVAALAFLRCRRIFPLLFIGNLILLLAFKVIDSLAVENLIGWTSQRTTDLGASLFQIFLGCAIWIPYMLISRRVRATFSPSNEEANTPSEPPPLIAAS